MLTLLLADDDPDDRLLALEALHSARVGTRVECVPDGETLLAYLRRKPPFDDDDRYPLPHLVLLDLNMPRMGGLEALRAIRADPALRHLPVLMTSTSRDRSDVLACYQAGCNAYVVKPKTFEGLVAAVGHTARYWLNTVELPELAR
ncbi:MAG TPA: response regulator [Lysobacter sp.]|nr:response regulator [Lysobacter sp.]